jgi:small subunit ribosomal protein S3Ae
MAIGKSKKTYKTKKGGKRVLDPLSRKEWYDFKAPVPFNTKSFGKTLVTRTTGTRIASEQVKGRVVEQSLADLKESSDQFSWRKIRLIIDEVEGTQAKTSFYGMDINRDKLCQMIRKWQSLIETFVDVKTADGYIMRLFVIAFTKKDQKHQRKTCYAQSSQIKDIRKKVTDIITKEVSKSVINDLVRHLITDTYTEKITKACQFIYPLQNVTIRKVKVLKRPKIDVVKMNEMYSHEKKVTAAHTGAKEEDEAVQNLVDKK